ncbi:head fiber protein [Citrobacter freundii]|uniref:head fiber protein n=1 Tax=Citrobacter freundii TaxID=546 RepID=UPI003CF059BE
MPAIVVAQSGEAVSVAKASETPVAATTATAGTVKQMPAIADLTAAPTQADFNGLLAKLRAAGILAS